MSPLTYTPSAPAHFIGPARQVADLLLRLAERGGCHRILLKGPPGTGKTALAKWFCRHVAGELQDFNIIAKNGTQVNVEAVDHFHEHIRYTSAGYRCILIDEADAIPPTAQTRLLSLLDQIKAARTGIAFVATSNFDFDKFPERLQTRFKPFEVHGPTPAETAAFLQQFVPAGQFAPVADLARMANNEHAQTGCNIRQALDDLDTALIALPHQQAA